MLEVPPHFITLLIVGITAVVSISAFSSDRLMSELLFEPYVIKEQRQWYRFITHAFIHSNWPHLFVNLFVLYMFGRFVEPALAMITGGTSAVPYVALYLGGVLFSTIPSYRRHVNDPNYRAVGASGAVSAVLFAQIIIVPTAPIGILFFPEPIPAWIFGILYLAYSWYMDKRSADNVAHDAHFYGAVFGVLFMIVLEPGLVLRYLPEGSIGL